MRELSLFTGAGGSLLGTWGLLGWEPIGAVEIDEYCCRVVEQRQRDGILPEFDIWQMDIRKFNFRVASIYQGEVDCITAGFPCQPFSVAGKQKADKDERNMWPETIECIRLVRPRFAFLENVPGLLSSGYFGTILGDLAESGYDCRWRILSAAEMGAPHKRDRLWIVAHSEGDLRRTSRDERSKASDGGGSIITDSTSGKCYTGTGERIRSEIKKSSTQNLNDVRSESANANKQHDDYRGYGTSEICRKRSQPSIIPGCEHVSDAVQSRLEGVQCKQGNDEEEQPSVERDCHEREWWAVEPGMGRVADGVADRVDRIKALGNGQVPAVAATAWRLLTEGMGI